LSFCALIEEVAAALASKASNSFVAFVIITSC
jgi:hypothetical protein